MQSDFTISVYKDLLQALLKGGYTFQTYRDFIQQPADKVILLRHDVDARKSHSFQFAQIQKDLGIQGTYYFRVVADSFDPKMMKAIEEMGHEVGLHYEEMDLARGDRAKAYELFVEHLKWFRSIVDIRTICMHGSPRSRFDNKDIWIDNDYKALGILGEPYFDLNTSEVFYITDTGMMWDGHRFSVRDKMSNVRFPMTYHTTQEIIEAIKQGDFPNRCMMNFHPQRWHTSRLNWFMEKFQQGIKNGVKRLILLYRLKK